MFTKREWIVILILGLVVVGVYGALLLVWVGGESLPLPSMGREQPVAGPTAEQARPTPPWEELTAREAYPLAQEVALAWQPDAQLTSVTSSWSNVSVDELARGKTTWAFYFLSPSARQAAIISVVGRKATVVQTQRVTKIPALLDATGWRVDSPLAIRNFLDNGGYVFLQEHPDADVHLRLVTQAANQTLLWMAVGLSAADQATIVVQIDAVTGQVKQP